MFRFSNVIYEKGKRDKNEDSIALHKLTSVRGDIIMALVCDGCGGMDEGSFASGTVAEEFSIWFYNELPDILRGIAVRKRLEGAVNRKLYEVHERLKSYGMQKDEKLGTTFTLFIAYGNKYICFQTGDSTVLKLTAKDAEYICDIQANGNVLTRCIGSGRYRPPKLSFGKIRSDTAFLVMSDGMYGKIKKEEFLKAAGPVEPADERKTEKRLKALADTALKRDCRDNMSLIYLRF
ncbi:MAG: protein phosphatase 2C domain-containing protein [Lachnospiraceae bacterium]|nr:protein phosphatase 2C domain-containing protein [Lachnospiraceae bacterium]